MEKNLHPAGQVAVCSFCGQPGSCDLTKLGRSEKICQQLRAFFEASHKYLTEDLKVA